MQDVRLEKWKMVNECNLWTTEQKWKTQFYEEESVKCVTVEQTRLIELI